MPFMLFLSIRKANMLFELNSLEQKGIYTDI